MSETGGEAINSRLEAENSRLSRRLQSYKDESARRKDALEKATRELEGLRSQVMTLEKERDTFKQQAAAGPEGLQAEVQKLRGEVTQYKHKDAWASLYADKDLALNPAIKPEKLWALLGYKADGDPDPAKIKADLLAEKEKGELSFVFAPAEGLPDQQRSSSNGNGNGIKVQQTEPGPGAGRSTPQHQPPDEKAQLAAYHASRGRTISDSSMRI